MTVQVQVVILAAGAGKRMCSTLPKVLHSLAGVPLLERVIALARKIAPNEVPMVVCGHERHVLQAKLHDEVRWITQAEPLGTGHAVLQALPAIPDDHYVLVLYGDVPLTSEATLEKLIETTPKEKSLGMLTAMLAQPQGYGRIKREKQRIVAVVEERDATEKERAIHEINSGIYFCQAAYLKKWLPRLDKQNAQNEYYLTDIVALAVKDGVVVHDVKPAVVEEILGVNDKVQLAFLERFYQRQQAENLLRQGVTLLDPARFDLRGILQVGKDITIDVNVILEGQVVLGDGCTIGPNCLIRDAVLGDRVMVKANSVIDGAMVANDAEIGPFARLRPGTRLAEHTHIGNFVEIKKSVLGEGTKVNHLSYVGDSEIGRRVNVGAGVITCNYDGVNKFKTTIGDGAFIGSCSQLVAPITVGEGATIGAGSTITQDAPAHQLTLTRAEQRTIIEWQRPVKESK
ncbi:MAG: UDP-N-acetylglucosamine diphosphorylase/glucosamine-1-phosphate N-acetyltransferase [Gammaproteobacteria bacterium RIFCSPHIGHO2_12_FULL_45_12]|nr:MAG: UDP-N-acetylglucosamine diphosphorylase/glucosamine-1-phosphate N-acetyltransferase [Gammaproteobacteria bacterium RIFCSPHIGHO2_12_FULL_45_12]